MQQLNAVCFERAIGALDTLLSIYYELLVVAMYVY